MTGIKKAYISEAVFPEVKDYLKEKGYTLSIIEKSGIVYDEVSDHPDIYMTRLGASACEKVYHGDKDRLGFRYPENIIYNAVVCGKFFIHNLKYTDKELADTARAYISRKYGCEMVEIHVPQGYAKCNMAVVDESHIITEDEGIAKAIGDYLNVLLISPKEVRLEGFSHGFIGGASGRCGDEIVFNGDITAHSDYEKIKAFIEDAGLGIKSFDYPLTDTGSIITEEI